MEILFKTVHGSRLYGLSNSESDFDYYTVVAKRPPSGRRNQKAKYAKQTILDNQDSMVVDFGTWMEMCRSGVPQALEAMYSQEPEIDLIGPLRAGFTVGTEVYSRYFRTIKSFALSEDESIKKRRHALRLAINLAELGRYGKFNPRLKESDIEYINLMATKPHEQVYGLAQTIAW